MKLFSLEGRTALVTGASRGLGRAMALALAEAGATAVLTARDRAKLDATAEEIRATGGVAEVEAFDLADEQAVSAAIAGILERHGRLDILLNNAAVMPRHTLEKATLEALDEAFNVNVRSAYVLCREAARPMIERRYGRIINVTSYVATVGRDGLHAYTVTKAGMAGLTRSLACELGPHNVTVNAISPGFFLTDMAAAIIDKPEIIAAYENSIALARAGRPEEIGGVAVFLASDASSYITGTTIDVDGGVANAKPMHVKFGTT